MGFGPFVVTKTKNTFSSKFKRENLKSQDEHNLTSLLCVTYLSKKNCVSHRINKYNKGLWNIIDYLFIYSSDCTFCMRICDLSTTFSNFLPRFPNPYCQSNFLHSFCCIAVSGPYNPSKCSYSQLFQLYFNNVSFIYPFLYWERRPLIIFQYLLSTYVAINFTSLNLEAHYHPTIFFLLSSSSPSLSFSVNLLYHPILSEEGEEESRE